jgi:hypothetical protein
VTHISSDEELLAAVRWLGENREPDEEAWTRAAELDAGGQPDLRGDLETDTYIDRGNDQDLDTGAQWST